MFRFVHPDVDLRVAGGREVCLGDQQPRALRAANSMFLEGYLTTPGQGASEDARMLAEAGYDVVEMINR
jgi:biotin synthase